ncbi:MAG: hypothetical protein HRT37_23430 [Alteromonadaceae bacterium]|nr:hypothetical protein [Alteromonadaceae bacterium]
MKIRVKIELNDKREILRSLQFNTHNIATEMLEEHLISITLVDDRTERGMFESVDVLEIIFDFSETISLGIISNYIWSKFDSPKADRDNKTKNHHPTIKLFVEDVLSKNSKEMNKVIWEKSKNETDDKV